LRSYHLDLADWKIQLPQLCLWRRLRVKVEIASAHNGAAVKVEIASANNCAAVKVKIASAHNGAPPSSLTLEPSV
jgi:hypothetical protein